MLEVSNCGGGGGGGGCKWKIYRIQISIINTYKRQSTTTQCLKSQTVVVVVVVVVVGGGGGGGGGQLQLKCDQIPLILVSTLAGPRLSYISR